MVKAKDAKLKFWENNLSEAEDIVLRCFFPEGKEVTIREIEDKSGYSYERVYTSLKGLIKKKIVSEKKIGKTLVYSLDYCNLYSKLAFRHYMTERLIDFANKHMIIYKAIEGIEEDPLGIILIFGSYSKETERETSDIDLMVISDYPKEREVAVQGLKYKYGLDIAPVFLPRIEFPKIKNENPELWQDMKKKALVFKGADIFYYWMYQK